MLLVLVGLGLLKDFLLRVKAGAGVAATTVSEVPGLGTSAVSCVLGVKLRAWQLQGHICPFGDIAVSLSCADCCCVAEEQQLWGLLSGKLGLAGTDLSPVWEKLGSSSKGKRFP